jgi:hypothetical protein
MMTAKIGSDGVTAWVRDYDGPAGKRDEGYAVAADGPGNFYVTGRTETNDGSAAAFVIAYNGVGFPVWSGTDGTSPGAEIAGRRIGVDQPGSVYVAGSVNPGSPTSDLLSLKFSPYLSKDAALGGDDRLRLLTVRADGSAAQLRLIDPATGHVLRVNTIPSPAGYAPLALATGADNKTYLLFQRADGQPQVWRYSADLAVIEKRANPGPVSSMRTVDLAVGLDGRVRLSLQGSQRPNLSKMFLWTLNDDLSGPTAAYSQTMALPQVGLSVGRDNRARVLWPARSLPFDRGRTWTFSAAGDQLQSDVPWGPYSTLAARDIAMGLDAKARLLWADTGGGAQVWRLDPAGTTTEKVFRLSAPITGATSTKLTASLVSPSMWVLWTYPDKRILLRQVNPSTGAVTAQYLYYPF